MKFVDLFAGLGGFHVALAELGHECVFASEIDPSLRDLYELNFGIQPSGDIRTIDASGIPSHDILCAGFPCQPFSKAGDQFGLNDPRGDLFFHIIRIIKHHLPRYVILENVPNFERHNSGQTWETLAVELKKAGYGIDTRKLSPHRFGIPQIRERVFIVGSLAGLESFDWPKESNGQTSIHQVLDSNPSDARPLSPQVLDCIDDWQTFLSMIPEKAPIPSFPIWGMEFGATYPFEDSTPWAIGIEKLRDFRGSHGKPLNELTEENISDCLPSYARSRVSHFPKWKIDFIRQNRAFYSEHRSWIDSWRSVLTKYPPSLQKFEWNAKGETRTLKDKVLQVRASGLRAKRPTTAPSLVAMTTTQVPIITWESRYMTPRECARLQSMPTINLPQSMTSSYAALGNAVNVEVVRLIASNLLAESPTIGDEERLESQDKAIVSDLQATAQLKLSDIPAAESDVACMIRTS